MGYNILFVLITLKRYLHCFQYFQNIKDARFKKMKNKLVAKGEIKDVQKKLKNSSNNRMFQHAVYDDVSMIRLSL